MAQRSSLPPSHVSTHDFRHSFPVFERNQRPSADNGPPASSLSSSSSVYPILDLPTTHVSTCMYLAPLPMQSCYVTPSASVEALLLALRGRNPHFCCVLRLTTGLRQRCKAAPAPLAIAAGGAHDFNLAAAGIRCSGGGQQFPAASAGCSAELDAICNDQAGQTCGLSSEEQNGASKRTVYVGWVGEFLSSADEAALSAAMGSHLSQLCDKKEVCSSLLPSSTSSFKFLGLSAALCDCYDLQPWEPVQLSFVHLDVIFAAAPHPPLPTVVSEKEYFATPSQFPFSAFLSSPSAVSSSAVSPTVSPGSLPPAKATPPLPPEQAVDAIPESAAARPTCLNSRRAKGRSRTPAADDNGNAAAEHVVAAEEEGAKAAAADGLSSERTHGKASWYTQLSRDVAPAFVEVRPVAEEDWEVVELQSARIEEELLMQIAVVMPSLPFPLWPNKGYARPAKLVAIPRPYLPSGGSSSSSIQAAPGDRGCQIKTGHTLASHGQCAVGCSRGTPSTLRTAEGGGGRSLARTHGTCRDEATGVFSSAAATSDHHVSQQESSGTATTSVAVAYPPFLLLSRDTELHVRPFVPKSPGPKLLSFHRQQHFSNSRVSPDFSEPAMCRQSENVGAAEGIQNATAASERSTEALRAEGKSRHLKKNHAPKISRDIDSSGSSSTKNRSTSSSNSASSSRAKCNHSSGHASGDKSTNFTAKAHTGDPPRADGSHAIRLDWDRERKAAAIEEEKVPEAGAPTNKVPSFRMRVVAANSRHLRRPAWVQLLRMFRAAESTNKTARVGASVEGMAADTDEKGEERTGEEEEKPGVLALGVSAKQRGLRSEGTQLPGTEGAGEGAAPACAFRKSQYNRDTREEEMGPCEDEKAEDEEEDGSLDLRRCYACWMHPCHVVALQKQQPWLQASLRQAAAADRRCVEQQLLNPSATRNKSLSKERLLLPASAPSCARYPSLSVSSASASVGSSSATAAACQQGESCDTAAYVWVSMVVPSERRGLNADKPGRDSAAAATSALAPESEGAAGRGTSGTETEEDSATAPSAARAAGKYMSTFSSSWRRAALSGLLLLTAFPDGRVAPGSVALPLHIRRVYSFPLCSFVFVTPCVSVPTLPRAIVALPLCPASLGLDDAVLGVATDLDSPSPPGDTAANPIGAVAAPASVAGAAYPRASHEDQPVGSRCPAVAAGAPGPATSHPRSAAASARTTTPARVQAAAAVRTPASVHAGATSGVKVSAAATAATKTYSAVPFTPGATSQLPLESQGSPKALQSCRGVPCARPCAYVRKKQQKQRYEEERDQPSTRSLCGESAPNLMAYLRTPRGRHDLKEAICEKLRTLTVENSSVSCGCVAGIATAAAAAVAAPASTAPLTRRVRGVGDDVGDTELIYYGCSRDEGVGRGSVFPFALWEGAVLQVPLALPQSVVGLPAGAEAAGRGALPAGRSASIRRANTRRRIAALIKAATAAEDTAFTGTAAKAGLAAAAAALVGTTAVSRSGGSRGPDCSTDTRCYERVNPGTESESDNQQVQREKSGETPSLLRSRVTPVKEKTEVPSRKTPWPKGLTVRGGCRQKVPPTDGEDAKPSGKRRGSLPGLVKNSEEDVEPSFLDEIVPNVLREGLQDLYASSSAESSPVADEADGECNSGMPVRGTRRKHEEGPLSREEGVTASGEGRFASTVGGSADSGSDSSRSPGRSCTSRRDGDDGSRSGEGSVGGETKYLRDYSSRRGERSRSQEGICRSTASGRSSSSGYRDPVKGSVGRSRSREEQAGSPSDGTSQHRRDSCRSTERISASHSNTVEVRKSTKKERLPRKISSRGGPAHAGKRSSSPPHGHNSHHGPADGRSRHDRAVQKIVETNSPGFPADLRAAQAAWVRDALLFDEALTTEDNRKEEETGDDEEEDAMKTQEEDDEDVVMPGVELEEPSEAEKDRQAMTPAEGQPEKEAGIASSLLLSDKRERKSSHALAVFPHHSSLLATQQEGKEECHMLEEKPDTINEKSEPRCAVTATDASGVCPGDAWTAPRRNSKRFEVAADGNKDIRASSASRRSASLGGTSQEKAFRRKSGLSEGSPISDNKSSFVSASWVTTQKVEEDGRSSPSRVVMLDVIVAFRSVLLSCVGDDAAAEVSYAADFAGQKVRGARREAETRRVLEDRCSSDYPCRDVEAVGERGRITLPQPPANVLPMAISLATQEYPLEFLFHRRANRQAPSAAVASSASDNVWKDIDSTEDRSIGRRTTSRNPCSSERGWRRGGCGPPAFVLCDAGFLHKCQQGKIPLQVLDPVVLLHASSSAEVASVKVEAAKAAASSERGSAAKSDTAEEQRTAEDSEEDLEATTEWRRGHPGKAGTATNEDAVGEEGTAYHQRRSDSSLVQFAEAAETARADVPCKAGERGSQHSPQAGEDAALTGGPSNSQDSRRTTCRLSHNKTWCGSSSRRSNISRTNASRSTTDKRSYFPPYLVLDAEQQSLAYTQWWLCDAVLRSRGAAAAAAAAHQEDGPEGTAAELLHLIQLQCAEQLNPDLLDLSAEELQRYLARVSPPQQQSGVRSSAKAFRALRVFPSHHQVGASHETHESDCAAPAAATVGHPTLPAALNVDAAAASRPGAAAVASAVEGAPASCVIFLPRDAAAVGKPPTLDTHRLVIRDLSFLAEGAAKFRGASCRPAVAAGAAPDTSEASGCSSRTAKGTEWREGHNPPQGRKDCVRAAASFLESLASYRELDEDEEDEDTAAGPNSANKLLLRLRLEFFEDCPAQLVRASKPKPLGTWFFPRLQFLLLAARYRCPFFIVPRKLQIHLCLSMRQPHTTASPRDRFYTLLWA